MYVLRLLLVFVEFCFAGTGCKDKEKYKVIKNNETGVDLHIPKNRRESRYAHRINKRTNALHMKTLRQKKVGKTSLEVRIWIGFGGAYLEGIVLKRDHDIWSGQYIPPWNVSNPVPLTSPSSGWENLWSRLCELKITELPDYSELEGEKLVLADGEAYVFEILTNKEYRTFSYTTPGLQKWSEAKNVVSIERVLRDEFEEF